MYGDMIQESEEVGIVWAGQNVYRDCFSYTEKSIEQETYGDLRLGKIALATIGSIENYVKKFYHFVLKWMQSNP